jgi:phosphoserine phosphatase RsbU/P
MGYYKVFRLKSLAVKLFLLYCFLAIVNMSIITTVIYENQVELIVENAKYRIRERAESAASSLADFIRDASSSNIFTSDKKGIVGVLESIAVKSSAVYAVFDEKGNVFASSHAFVFLKKDIIDGMAAISGRDFAGRKYFSDVDPSNYTVSYYIPVLTGNFEDRIVVFRYNVSEIRTRLNELYKMVLFIILLIVAVHILLGFILYNIFVKPVSHLHQTSINLRQGDLSARVGISSKDEIGELGIAFNEMATSIQTKVKKLTDYNNTMNLELSIASDVQRIIFPKSGRIFDKFNAAFYQVPYGKVCGDYYDIFDFGNGRYGFLIADVSGHGTPAALLTMLVKEIFKRFATTAKDPSALLSKVNYELCDILEKGESGMVLYMTCFLTIIENNTLYYSGAGHPYPLIIRNNEKSISTLSSEGLILGIDKNIKDMHNTQSIQVKSGDKIIMYTDGVTEANIQNGKAFGITRLIQSVQKSYNKAPQEIIDEIVSDLSSFCDITSIKDDTTIVIIEV